MKLKIKKGDVVQVMTGSDKGKTGRVLEIYPKEMRLLVEQVNLRHKHSRPTQMNPKGGKVTKEMPIHYSNVMMLDSEKKPTKLAVRFEEKAGKKVAVRYAKTNKKDL